LAHSQPPWLGLDRPGLLQASGGLILGLIALLTSYDHITLAGHTTQLPQQWGIACIAASVATVFMGLCNTARHIGATLNWRRDPGYEQRLQKLRLETEQSRERTKLIEKEIEQLDRENAREQALSALIRQRRFPPKSSSMPPPATGSDGGSCLR